MDDTVQENQLNGKQTDWLRDIKYRYFPQQKKEWSEEDERMLDTVIEDIIKLAGPYVCYHKDVEWLKSLRLQNTWKPSDEHYELEEFAKIVRCNLTGISKTVQNLFEAKYLQLTGNKMYGGYTD